MITGLITIIVYIAILGLVVWAITTFIPMPPQFKTLIYVIVGIVALLILLQLLTGNSIPLLRF
jgi:hypothetical protein